MFIVNQKLLYLVTRIFQKLGVCPVSLQKTMLILTKMDVFDVQVLFLFICVEWFILISG